MFYFHWETVEELSFFWIVFLCILRMRLFSRTGGFVVSSPPIHAKLIPVTLYGMVSVFLDVCPS